ncbi:hypothetical protein E2C01_089772 [Portunus trituberculatus]|uniref:Uncharacterized protein n=1 Tax=Portunus trituberculatus TaxID=210409 RepID=A0A5B7JQI7_PORTR|nr:hypothetical protein [Portunus trituberculatus]
MPPLAPSLRPLLQRFLSRPSFPSLSDRHPALPPSRSSLPGSSKSLLVFVTIGIVM